MKNSGSFKYKGVILLFSIVLVAIAIMVFYWVNNSQDKIEREASPKATSTTSTASSPLAVSPISPISPISPPPPPPTKVVRPAEIEAMIQRGIARYESQDYQEAIAIFNETLVLDPNNFLVYNARGSVYNALKDYESAIADYTKAIELEPFFPHAPYNRGRTYSFLKRYDEALTDLQKSIDLSSDEFGYRANGNIGLIYHKQGQYDKSLEAFEKAISFDDTKADTYYLHGETYTALENYEAAITDYQAAITRFSRYDLAYQSLGYAYYKTGQFDQALEALNQALEISPDSPIAHFYLGLVRLATDDFDGAKAAVEQAVNSITILAEEEQNFILARVRLNLETFAQENPSKAEEAQSLIDLIQEP